MIDSLPDFRRSWPHVVVTGLLLFSHLVATFGWPFPIIETGKPRDLRGDYPCANRLCGCATYDECWAGDCCCFTLQEKIDWAMNHRENVPEHVPSLVHSCEGETCCSKEHHATCEEHDAGCCHAEKQTGKSKWVIGLFAQKCKGVKLGYGMLEPVRPFDTLDVVLAELVEGDHLIPSSERSNSFDSPPDSPPPNHF